MSVVIPVFNRAGWIAEAIASARSQEPPPGEILVVDDGSVDDSASAAAAAPGVTRVLRLDRSRGPAAARNAGIREARGDWLAFLDSDDRWLPGSLEARLRAADRSPDIVLVSGNAESWDGIRTVRSRMLEEIEHDAADPPLPRLLRGNFVLTSTALARREAVLGIGGFAEHLRRCEDYDLWLRLARHGRFAFVDEPLARYRIGPGGLSADSDRMIEAEAQVLREAIAGARACVPDRWVPVARERLGRLWLDAGYLDLVAHRPAEARRKLVRALRFPGSRRRAFAHLAATLLPSSAADRIRSARGREKDPG